MLRNVEKYWEMLRYDEECKVMCKSVEKLDVRSIHGFST